MSHQEVKVRRDAVVPCMTCPLCNEICDEATTITECLHTFCKICIYQKLQNEEMASCPVCSTQLGCSPLEKLRADNNMQDVIVILFPFKRPKTKSPEPEKNSAGIVEGSNTCEGKGDPWKPLNCLVEAANRSESSKGGGQGSATGLMSHQEVKVRRDAVVPCMTCPLCNDICYEATTITECLHTFCKICIYQKLQNEEMVSCPVCSTQLGCSPLEKLRADNNMQDVIAILFPFKRPKTKSPEPEKNSAGVVEGSNTCEEKGDPWKPLNCLVEAANRTESSKGGGQGSATELMYPRDNGVTANKRSYSKSKIQDDNVPSDSERPKKKRKVCAKKAQNFGDYRIPAQVLMDASRAKFNNPIWFSLVSHEEPEANGPPLPQISANYIRIKDGSIPVSFIQKYLKAKLDLTAEDEVEIKCMGQTVIPSLTLNNLVHSWLQKNSEERVTATIGSSAKDFVMVLGYARRHPSVS